MIGGSTLKASGTGASLFDRSEWESEAPAGGPDPDLFEPGVRDTLRSARNLTPLFETQVDRTTWTFQEGAPAVEVVLDRGMVSADGAESLLAEVELERSTALRTTCSASPAGSPRRVRSGSRSKPSRSAATRLSAGGGTRS